MAKKETSTKSFVLRVDAATMDAIESGQPMSFVALTDSFSGLSLRHCGKAGG